MTCTRSTGATGASLILTEQKSAPKPVLSCLMFKALHVEPFPHLTSALWKIQGWTDSLHMQCRKRVLEDKLWGQSWHVMNHSPKMTFFIQLLKKPKRPIPSEGQSPVELPPWHGCQWYHILCTSLPKVWSVSPQIWAQGDQSLLPLNPILIMPMDTPTSWASAKCPSQWNSFNCNAQMPILLRIIQM